MFLIVPLHFILFNASKGRKRCIEEGGNFIGIAMILVVVALGYSKSRQPENLDTLLLDNVEALAAGEAADGGDCIGSGSIVCPFNNTEVAHVLVYYSLPH